MSTYEIMKAPSSNDSIRTVARDFSWFLYDIDLKTGEFVFVRTDRNELAQEVFLDPRWKPHTGETRRFPIKSVIEELSAFEHATRLNFVWHTSLCCSTLLMKLIDLPGHNLSLREPKVLVTLADALRAGLTEKGLLPREAVVAIFALLARAEAPDAGVIVKPSNFSNFLVREAACHCQGKVLFLYSDLPSFLISIAKGGVGFCRYARQLFGNIAGDLGQPLPWSGPDLLRMTDLEIASLAWHLQIAEFRRSWPELGDTRAASLDCEAFLAKPDETLQRLDGFFQLGFPNELMNARAKDALFSSHAKLPEQSFSPQMRRSEMEDARRRLGADLDRVVEWSYRAWPSTPKDTPLANPLVLQPRD